MWRNYSKSVVTQRSKIWWVLTSLLALAALIAFMLLLRRSAQNPNPSRSRAVWSYDERLARQKMQELHYLRNSTRSSNIKDVNIKVMTEKDITLTLHTYLDNIDIPCRRKLRMGATGDGGWDICDDPEVRPVPPCFVYSFGIGFSWSFDDDASQLYGCHVFSFDPTMNVPHHDRSPFIHFYPWGLSGETKISEKGWPMFTMADIKRKLGHTNMVIDVVKMDIESSEWSALPQMVATGAFDGVKQFSVEYHVTEYANQSLALQVAQAVEREGFKKFFAHKNHACSRLQPGFPTAVTSCYEVTYMRLPADVAGQSRHGGL